MPELPEVETIARQLNKKLHGKTISSVTLSHSGREFPSGKKFISSITGKTVKSITRRAKLLIWNFTDGTALIAHLKMTGRFVIADKNFKPTKHDRAIFIFKSPLTTSDPPATQAKRSEALQAGSRHTTLIWSDIRKFGFVKYVQPLELKSILACYGPEPLESEIQHLADRLKAPKKTRKVKAALLDQKVIAGIGNIYADEALHRAKLRPTRRLASLTAADRLRLAREIQTVLRESLDQGGTSANDYVDANGAKGRFLSFLRVYGRTGEKCRACGTFIKRIVVVQRGTHYCPTCQK